MSGTPRTPGSLYEELFRRRDEERSRRVDAVLVVSGDSRPVEDSPQGRLRWYLHPALDGAALRTLGLYVQRLHPGAVRGGTAGRAAKPSFSWPGGE
ncbi:MAG TPA: hypothetical protein VGL92_10665 [Acidimicrobiia bacterium]|jgi:hypothetical protein